MGVGAHRTTAPGMVNTNDTGLADYVRVGVDRTEALIKTQVILIVAIITSNWSSIKIRIIKYR